MPKENMADLFLEQVSLSPEEQLERAIKFIGENYEPSDVFSSEQLNDWATKEGFVREDN